MTALISRDALQAAIGAGTVTVVDALGGDYYAKQHLPGAVALAPGDVDALASTVLPDKNAVIVTYCTGSSCHNSGQVATQLTTIGYTKVRKYAVGLQDWNYSGLRTASGHSDMGVR